MKRLLHSLTMTSVAAVVLLSANDAVGNEQTLDPAQNNAGSEPILLAQNAASKEEKSTSTTANVDGKGVILKGYDAVAYFKQGKPLKGNPEIASTYQGSHTCLRQKRIKLILTKIPQSTFRGMVAFAPTE